MIGRLIAAGSGQQWGTRLTLLTASYAYVSHSTENNDAAYNLAVPMRR
jgi:hypothetical protein